MSTEFWEVQPCVLVIAYFMQCLEGEINQVNHLLNVIKQDNRHADIKILREAHINQKTFNRWNMKYTGVGYEILKLLELYGFDEFNPYNFNETILEKVIDYLSAN